MVPGASWHCLRTFQLPYCVLVHMLSEHEARVPYLAISLPLRCSSLLVCVQRQTIATVTLIG